MRLFCRTKHGRVFSTTLLTVFATTGCGENALFTQPAYEVPATHQPEWLSSAHKTCADGFKGFELSRDGAYHMLPGTGYEADYQEAQLEIDAEKEDEYARIRTRGVRPDGFIVTFTTESGATTMTPYHFRAESDAAIVEKGEAELRLQSIELCYRITT